MTVNVLWENGKQHLWDPLQNGILVLYFPAFISLNLKRVADFEK